MNTLIFRTFAPYLTSLMLLFSVFVLLRGHNEPGGGFIGGLIAVSAFAILGIAKGVESVRRSLRVHPISIAAFGLVLAAAAGLPSLASGTPFLTAHWLTIDLVGTKVDLSTPLVFDIGVYLVVLGSISAIFLALEDDGGA
ncbi:Na+/H+ antiporter subunit B [Segnochrobactrum spirostomi]|uniref:Na+/H+ antiporter subunit B n=1 Tax=Segnochrobactrum spirostomi TaxID=2608987 RepID=A0A6A7Y1U1_9HYPH|nr:Na+/H+ antiporter subunit B [Segnochrobactrum spirostomi]MQT12347.1 Na+/H+ antiporter subunit B [Segnochrobactrum spirostomi]